METRRARWANLIDVQKQFPKAEAVVVRRETYTVFNLRLNRFRLVVKILYEVGRVYIKHLMTHAEYSRETWKIELAEIASESDAG